jgi:3-hydroxyacyl-CoA dehydrogenase/enoyl-CoA hydratase/3-hydroxybutyryl-CoA epimerase
MHGYAMGGRLEIALTCVQRIALEGMRFGFSEVQLGLHPGLGGTARFTHLCDFVSRLDLVEVIRHDAVAVEMEEKAKGLVGAIGKLPTPARSAPGFIVNRILTPDLGMPMGPLELAD